MTDSAHNADIAAHLRAALAAISDADEGQLKSELRAIVEWQDCALTGHQQAR
jgi:hypothetical protein